MHGNPSEGLARGFRKNRRPRRECAMICGPRNQNSDGRMGSIATPTTLPRANGFQKRAAAAIDTPSPIYAGLRMRN